MPDYHKDRTRDAEHGTRHSRTPDDEKPEHRRKHERPDPRKQVVR